MLIITLAWRATESGATGRSFTTVDHLRRILERLEMLTTKQGNALCKDARVQRLFKRKAVFAYSGAPSGDAIWLTRKPLLALVPSDDGLDADSLKMLRNYRVFVTRSGIEEARSMWTKYADTRFTHTAVDAIEEVFAAERDEFEKKRALGSIIGNYNEKVSSDARRHGSVR